jgi:hypothetical protein
VVQKPLLGLVSLDFEEVEAMRGDDLYTSLPIASSGSEPSEAQAAELEQGLKLDPESTEARLKLLGFYLSAQIHSSTSDRRSEYTNKRAAQLYWLIEHRPDASICITPYGRLEPDRDAYSRGREAWLAQVEKDPTNPVVLENAAWFMSKWDEQEERGLLERARGLRQR